MSRKPLLVELLTEELPPKALKKLGVDFGNQIFQHLKRKNCVQRTRNTGFLAPQED
jgi:glycyl-tRNA synthetase beta subunit